VFHPGGPGKLLMSTLVKSNIYNQGKMRFYSGLMGFYSGLMGFYSDLMGFYSDLMGY